MHYCIISLTGMTLKGSQFAKQMKHLNTLSVHLTKRNVARTYSFVNVGVETQRRAGE